MMKRVRKSWLFQSKTNMAITTLFFSATALVYRNIQKKRKLDHPVVYEALCVLENNRGITEMIGFPLTTDTKYNSLIKASEDQVNYRMVLRGPRGKIEMEISGQGLPLSEISGSKTLLKEFYIPSLEYGEKVYKSQVQPELKEIPIDPNTKFWKLNSVQIFIDKNNPITVVPSKDSELPDAFGNRENVGDLVREREARKSIYRDLECITENEREELRKVRMLEMYNKTSEARFYLGFFVIFSAMSGYITFVQGKRLALTKSQIFDDAVRMVTMSPQIQQAIGSDVRVGTSTRGARIKNEAKFEFDAFGKSGYGIVKIFGEYDPKKNLWSMNEAFFDLVKNGEVAQRINLK